MSIKVMNAVWAYADCKSSELLVLLALADFSDDNGENAYPSMATLAKKARLSDKQVRRVVQTLVELKLLEIVEEGGWKHGRNRSNSYRIRLENIGTPKLGVLPPAGEGYSHPRENGTPTDGGTVLPPAGDNPSSYPSYNPPVEKKRPPRAQKKNYRPDEYSDIILG